MTDGDEYLEPTEIADVVKYSLCPQYTDIRFKENPDNSTDDLPISTNKLSESPVPTSPALAAIGDEYEEEIVDELITHAGHVFIWDDDYEPPTISGDITRSPNIRDDIVPYIEKAARGSISSPIILIQPQLAGQIAQFNVGGAADVIIIWPSANGKATARIRVFDVKAGKEKPHHQIQASIYATLFEDEIAKSCGEKYRITAGIIDGETDISTVTPDSLPSFSYESRREDIIRLLDEDGIIIDTFDSTDHDYDLGRAAQDSDYREVYHVLAAEERDIRLLGLSRAAQNAYREQGLEKVEDVARLVEKPDSPKPYEDYPAIRDGWENEVRTLNEDPRIDERVQVTAQRAQVKLGLLNPSHPFAADDYPQYGRWIQGTGEADLPEDSPHSNYPTTDFHITEGGMIRVYIDVQIDYLAERVVMLSASVDCTAAHIDEPATFSVSVDELASDGDGYESSEEELYEEFIEQLFRQIRRFSEVAKGETAPHFYFFTEGEREQFEDGLERHHAGLKKTELLKRMFNLRAGIRTPGIENRVEQEMVSILQPIVQKHYAFPEPGLSVPHTLRKLQYVDPMYWTYDRGSGETINLRNGYRFKFFDRQQRYTYNESGTLEILEGDGDGEGRYTTKPQYNSQLPLEYFWAANGIDTPDIDWIPEDNKKKQEAEKFKWEQRGDTRHRLTQEDIEALGEKIALSLRHIERELGYCRKTIDTEPVIKHPLPSHPKRLDNVLPTLDSTLREGCTDYLDLENHSEKEELDSVHETPPVQRIKEGVAVPVRITDVVGSGRDAEVHGELAYEELGFTNAGFTARACRLSDNDRVLATKLKYEGGEHRVDEDVAEVTNAPVLCIEHLDFNDEPNVEISLPWVNQDGVYDEWHRYARFGGSDGNAISFDEGDLILLDEKQMTLVRERARSILQETSGNTAYQLLEQIQSGSYSSSLLETDEFSSNNIDDFLDDMGANSTDENELVDPNTKQEKFIRKINNRISLLQGPPGTGKTKGALAPTLLSRVHSMAADYNGFTGCVTAPTHTAINEVLEEVAEVVNDCRKEDVGNLSNLTLLRIDSSSPAPNEQIDGVEYVSYNDDTDISSFRQQYWDAIRNSNQTQLTQQQFILFGTSQAIYKLMEAVTGVDETEELYANAPDAFDLLAVDEASMFTLPELMMSGAFITQGTSQLIIAGDHRQMPPVQHHEWLGERRASITQTVPYLSTLNFFRFLRGETVERVEEQKHLNATSPNADIEFTKLNKTYRCHKTVTEFLRRWVYSKDKINYTSDETDVISKSVDTDIDGLEEVFNPAPIVLITHDNTTNQQFNPAEAEIAAEIFNELEDEHSVGIVTPHNAQKAYLRVMCESRSINTVESFQGGERDSIIISATVSDPAYIDAESDFILNPNRLNVALSRMKKKLVVIAPETLFETIPSDTETYENSQIWKGLNKTVTSPKPAAEGVVETSSGETEFEVHLFDSY